MKITKDRIIHYATFSLISLTFLSGLFLSYFSTAHATNPVSTTAYATVHVSEACTLSASITSAHYIAMDNGTYEDDIGSTKFTVKCNDPTGFALYAIGYSNEKYGNTNMLGQATSLTIPTGTDTTLGNTASHWSMKVTKDTTSYVPANLTINNGFDSYHAVPEDYTKVVAYSTSTDGPSGTGAAVTITYNARISGTQVADSYVGKVKYTLVHPSTASKPLSPLVASYCPAESICYVPNVNDIGSMAAIGTTEDLTSVSPNAGTVSITTRYTKLIAPNFKRQGYGFAGWSTDFEATNESIIYGPNQYIDTNQFDTSENGLILYPVWVASADTIQNWDGCGNLDRATYNSNSGEVVATLSSVTALTDARDKNTYAVARLVDGECWMIENLRLDNTVSATTLAAGSQGIGAGFTKLPASEISNWNSNTANEVYSGLTTHTMPRIDTNNTNLGGTNASGISLTENYGSSGNALSWYSYGNYYSWPAAIASTASFNYSTSINTSICPNGWHLPFSNSAGGTNAGSFGYLNNLMGNDSSERIWLMFPTNIVLAGYWSYSGTSSNRSIRGDYWGAASQDQYGTYSLSLSSFQYSSANVSTHARTLKNYGASVRCITSPLTSK